MIPGVTHLPAASSTTASGGASTTAPTATTLPSRISSEPFSMRSPTAVRIVAFRIRRGGDAAGR